jgi:hypothetical protein
MESVFVLQHLHLLPTGEEDVKLLGVYRSLEGAYSAVERLRISLDSETIQGLWIRKTIQTGKVFTSERARWIGPLVGRLCDPVTHEPAPYYAINLLAKFNQLG